MASTEGEATILKVIMMGGEGVGKSSLLCRLIDDGFSSLMDIEMRVHDAGEIEGKRVKIRFLDNKGDDLRLIRDKKGFFAGTHGIVFVYDVSDKESFDYGLKKQMRHVNSLIDDYLLNPHVKIILLGNKCEQSQRNVTFADGKELADARGWQFFETSANMGGVTTPLINGAESKGCCSGCSVM